MLAHRSAFSLKTQSVVNAVYDTTLFAIGNRKDAEKCFICEPLAKPCFASGVFRCQVSGVRKNHTMLRLPET
jgi:hypothetical protein